MAEQAYEFTGKTVEDAIDEGLQQTGLPRNQVNVEIISKGSRGIFGLGSEPARVRIRPKAPPARQARPLSTAPADEETPGAQPRQDSPKTHVDDTASSLVSTQDESAPAERTPVDKRGDTQGIADTAADERDADAEEKRSEASSSAPDTLERDGLPSDEEELKDLAVEFLDGMLSRMGFAQAEIVASWQEDDEDSERYLLLDVQGDDLGILIGRRGETLASIQYLVRLMINQRLRQWKNVVIDIEQYKQRRVTQLTQLANRMAEQVVDSGRAISLEPMPANERRIVHLALRNHPAVYTQSSGEGDRRKVHIVAKE